MEICNEVSTLRKIYDDISSNENKVEIMRRFTNIIYSIVEKSQYGGVSANMVNYISRTDFSQINDNWWNAINIFIVNDITHHNKQLFRMSICELRVKYTDT